MRIPCSVCQGDLGVRRARYEARWHAFAAAAAGAAVAYAAVPWLSDHSGADIGPIVFYGTTGAAALAGHRTLR